MDSTVFISYRREISAGKPQWLKASLERYGFDVWVDTDRSDSVDLHETILAEIERRAHFLLLLEPGTLDRIAKDEDFVCAEIRHAIATRRSIVPVLLDGADTPRSWELPADIAELGLITPLRMSLDADGLKRLIRRLKRFPQRPGLQPDPLWQIYERSANSQDASLDILMRGTGARPQLYRVNSPGHGVLLQWQLSPLYDDAPVELQRSVSPTFLTVTKVYAGHGWRFVDRTASGQVVYYRARLPFDGDIAGAWSDTVQVKNPTAVRSTPPEPLRPPPILDSTAAADGIRFFWKAVPHAVEYQLVRIDPLAQELPGSAGHEVVYRGPATEHTIAEDGDFWPRFHVRARCPGDGWTDWSRPVRQ